MSRAPSLLVPLLIIVFHLFSINQICADERVRLVQEQLRKRHLFYGDLTGEPSPALTAAITRYQQRKGFPGSGMIDSDTCRSLGISEPTQEAERTLFVVGKSGVARGPNGESLPSSPSIHEQIAQGDPPLTDGDRIALARIGCVDERKGTLSSTGRSHGRTSRIQPRKETNPIMMAFHSIDHAIKFLRGDTPPKKKHPAKRR